MLVALTLGPAIITVASRFGLLEPKRAMRIRGWRKIGAAIVRWPGPVLLATVALSLVGLLTLPGYQPNYNDRNYLPADLPAKQGFAAAERHFSAATDEPRTAAHRERPRPPQLGGLPGDRQDRQGHLPGAGHRQRPGDHPPAAANPSKFSTIPAQMSMGGAGQDLNRKYMQDRMADMLVQADEMQTTIDTMTKMIDADGRR